jgi:opacity protein-like surface antigen
MRASLALLGALASALSGSVARAAETPVAPAVVAPETPVALAPAPAVVAPEIPGAPTTAPAPAVAQEPGKETPAVSAIEVDLHLGYGFMVLPKVDHRGETFSRNGGPTVGLGVIYRSSYFLSPVLDVVFQPLYRSTRDVDVGAGPTTNSASLRTLGVSLGAVLDIWKLRLGAGIGDYKVLVRSSLNGNSLRASEWDMGYTCSAGVFLWNSPRLRIGLESRVGMIIDAETTFFSIGAFVAGDALRW